MKNFTNIIFLICISFFLIFCKKEELTIPNNGENLMVSGIVQTKNQPIANAVISIDSSTTWRAVSSNDGSFAISDVPNGEHTIEIETGDKEGNFTRKMYKVNLTKSTSNLKSISLPNQVNLFTPNNASNSSLNLTWNKSTASDFYEYKLYRHTSAGLDEVTGELIYVTTNINDTAFKDETLISSNKYYYRVFVRNKTGQLGGSNLVNSSTTNGNLVPSGDFEDLAVFNTEWQVHIKQGTILTTLVDTVFKGGKKCLYNHNDSAYTRGNTNVYTALSLKKAIAIGSNKTYEISGWMMTEGVQTDIGDLWIIVKQGNEFITTVSAGFSTGGVGGNGHMNNNTGWEYHSKTFTTTSNTPVTIELVIPFEHVWFDDIKLRAL